MAGLLGWQVTFALDLRPTAQEATHGKLREPLVIIILADTGNQPTTHG